MKRGDIVQLGRHRLMCGDCTNSEDVNSLFMGLQADFAFTSPPYLSKRIYGQGNNQAPCWTTMMIRCFDFPHTEDCQVFVNLGHCHSNNEWHAYWSDWQEQVRRSGWRRFGMYIWDTNSALPGHAHGRLLARYEFVFHVNKKTRFPNKIMQTKGGGTRRINGNKVATSEKEKDSKQNWCGRYVQQMKCLDNIIKSTRCRERATGHPARFPASLVAQFILSYTQEGSICYDPFAGVGSSILAAENTRRRCMAMEIEPSYCAMTIERYHKHIEKLNAPSKPKRKVVSASGRPRARPEPPTKDFPESHQPSIPSSAEISSSSLYSQGSFRPATAPPLASSCDSPAQ